MRCQGQLSPSERVLTVVGARAQIWAPCLGTGTSSRDSNRAPCPGMGTSLNRFSSVPAVFTFSQAAEVPTPNLLVISP